MNSNLRTRITLIQRARQQNNEEAWKEFVHYYRPFIFYILNQMNIGKNDINDLIQEILIKLWKNLVKYESNKSRFRTWLSTIIRNCSYDFFRKQSHKIETVSHDEITPNLLKGTSNDDLELLIEKEWKVYLTRLAMEQLSLAFKGQAITVFEMSMKGKPSEEIAKKLGLTTQSVHTLKNRVKKHFTCEVQRLIQELEF